MKSLKGLHSTPPCNAVLPSFNEQSTADLKCHLRLVHLWAELEETLLRRATFAFGGLALSLFFLFFFDIFCFSSEELQIQMNNVHRWNLQQQSSSKFQWPPGFKQIHLPVFACLLWRITARQIKKHCKKKTKQKKKKKKQHTRTLRNIKKKNLAVKYRFFFFFLDFFFSLRGDGEGLSELLGEQIKTQSDPPAVVSYFPFSSSSFSHLSLFLFFFFFFRPRFFTGESEPSESSTNLWEQGRHSQHTFSTMNSELWWTTPTSNWLTLWSKTVIVI